MSEVAKLLADLGYEAPSLEWRTTSTPPIPAERFGRDHWSTFAYIEIRIVDHRGTLRPDNLRVHAGRHPAFSAAQLRASGGHRYPTRLNDGEIDQHDDIDCIDDLIAAGLLEVHMPRLAEGFHVGEYYVDAWGKPITVDGELIEPGFVTGLTELRLCVYATFPRTERGRQVAGDLRAHLAVDRNFGTFRLV